MKPAVQSGDREVASPIQRDGSLAIASRPARPVLSFEGVSKSYLRNAGRSLLRHRLVSWLKRAPMETVRALEDISFDILEGESLAVVGASAC